jgi:hypothetical protein
VVSALEDVFARNRHTQDGESDAPRALAEVAVRTLLDPDNCALADVGGLRLHLTVPDPDYGGPAEIYVSAWDDEAEVWRGVAHIPLAVD